MGYIKVDRKILNNKIWNEQPFSRGQAWLDLLLMADYETKHKMWRGKLIMFQRGDVNISIRWLAERWGWSYKKARCFLELLQNEKMIQVKAHRNRSVITITNYGTYQDTGFKKEENKAEEAVLPQKEEEILDDIDWDSIPD